MSAKRIIIGDSEISVPDKLLSMGVFPIIVIAIVVWLLLGLYSVGPDEVGVVQRFGKYDRVVGSGLNYHFPYPIETVKTPKITEVKRIEIGFRTVGKNQYRTIEQESLMLTGDENIVDAELIVQYKIKEPINYLFNFIGPELTLREASEASLRTVIGRHNIDEALTSGKFMIQEETKELLQITLDKYETGVIVVAVQLQDVSPPKQVIDAFKDVASAKEDKNRMINEAEGYAIERVNNAKGDAALFDKVLIQYNKAPEITRDRLYIEAMENVLGKISHKVIVDPNLENFLPLMKIESKGGN